MKRLLPLLPLFLPAVLSAQTVLFEEGFEGTPAFTLNTTDVSSAAGGANTWLINDAYTGGSGEIECFGLPFGFTVPNTAGQPAGIADANGAYLHITSEAAIASGVQNCCFAAADGFCTDAANHFAAMSTDVSTVGQGEVSLSFWWLCGGGNNNYGEVYYSTNGGNAWSAITTPIAQYRNQSAWVQQTITLPAFAEQVQLRFGFRFVNGTALNASDPGFGVDDVRITASAATNSISTGSLTPLSYCQGATVEVPFTIVGSFNAGNTFTAELSNASGSFAAPVTIGSIAGSGAGTINATIPPGTPVGTGYRIRVVSDDPPVEGLANTANLQVVAAPFAGNDVDVAHCTSDPIPDLLALVDGGASNGDFYYQGLQLLPDLTEPGDYEVLYIVPGAGGCAADTAEFVITVLAAPNAGTGVSITVCAYDASFALFDLLSGSPESSGVWNDPEGAVHSGSFDPAVDEPGLYTYEVVGEAPCDPDRAFIAIAVDPCVGIAERAVDPVRWLGQEGDAQLFRAPANTSLQQVQVLDATGRSMHVGATLQRQGDRIRIGFAGMPTGLYFVRFNQQPVMRVVHSAR
ncbi:MAG: hypothetical protein H6592_13890 [Flavobacteriales bacterium]|nr:hypothetical protein [Flavobacteriales bacterium]